MKLKIRKPRPKTKNMMPGSFLVLAALLLHPSNDPNNVVTSSGVPSRSQWNVCWQIRPQRRHVGPCFFFLRHHNFLFQPCWMHFWAILSWNFSVAESSEYITITKIILRDPHYSTVQSIQTVTGIWLRGESSNIINTVFCFFLIILMFFYYRLCWFGTVITSH